MKGIFAGGDGLDNGGVKDEGGLLMVVESRRKKPGAKRAGT